MATIGARRERDRCPHFEQVETVARCWSERDRKTDKPRRCIHLKQGDCEELAALPEEER